MNSPLRQADRGPGQRLFQPCLPLAIRNGPVQHRQQCFDLAEFRRPLMTGPVNRALEQPKPDFLGQTGKRASVEAKARPAPLFRRSRLENIIGPQWLSKESDLLKNGRT